MQQVHALKQCKICDVYKAPKPVIRSHFKSQLHHVIGVPLSRRAVQQSRKRVSAAATAEAVRAPGEEGSRLDGKLKIIGASTHHAWHLKVDRLKHMFMMYKLSCDQACQRGNVV